MTRVMKMSSKGRAALNGALGLSFAVSARYSQTTLVQHDDQPQDTSRRAYSCTRSVCSHLNRTNQRQNRQLTSDLQTRSSSVCHSEHSSRPTRNSLAQSTRRSRM